MLRCYGNHSGTIRAHRPLPPGAAGQRQHPQPASAQRHSLSGGARLQVARTARTLRQLAYGLYSDEPQVQKGRAGPGLCRLAGGRYPAGQIGSGGPGQYHREEPAPYLIRGASGRDGSAPKKGLQAIGKSRGGWNTKIHLVAADDRRAVTFALSPGEPTTLRKEGFCCPAWGRNRRGRSC